LSLDIINEGFPEEFKSQLLNNEKVHYFSYISYKGGCLSSSSREEYWIALTNNRVIYKTKILEEKNKMVEKHGVLPLDKISFIEVTDVKQTSGCGSAQTYELRISTSGGTVRIPLPNKEKGYEIRRIYTDIAEKDKKKSKKYHE
jgi:hypothetical protein